MTDLEQVDVSLDELEALRLADQQGLYHEQAAGQMMVSRQTFGRILESARRKVADALLSGKVLRVDQGAVDAPRTQRFECSGCRHSWRARYGKPRPSHCPSCRSEDIRWSSSPATAARSGRGQQLAGTANPGRGKNHEKTP
jgi:predicted DNA-binding protein (UPF0251 family)